MLLPSTSELLIILSGIVLLFGGRKLPQLGSAIGESIRNFKKGLNPEAKDSSELPAQHSGTDDKK